MGEFLYLVWSEYHKAPAHAFRGSQVQMDKSPTSIQQAFWLRESSATQ